MSRWVYMMPVQWAVLLEKKQKLEMDSEVHLSIKVLV